METRKNVFYNVLLAITQVLFPLITFPYLARTLGPEHVGVLNFAESFARYFVLLAALGIPIYGVREVAKAASDRTLLTKTFSEIFIINALGTLLLSVIFLGFIIALPQLAAEKSLFYWALGYFILQIFQLEWFFSGMNQFKFIAIRSLVIRLCFIAAVFLFIRNTNDYVNYFRMQVGLAVVLAVLNGKKLWNLLDFSSLSLASLAFKKHIKPMALLFLTIFTISVYFSLDTILLGFLADNESVGFYSSALKLNRLFIGVLSAISVAMFPGLVSLYHKGEKEAFVLLIKQCFYVLVSLSMPLVLGIVLCAPEIIHILLGTAFERAILPLQITAPLILIISMSGIFGFQILSAVGKDKSILISALIGMFISIILAFQLVPTFKENGAAITILFTELAVCIAFIFFTRKEISLSNYTIVFFQQLLGLIPYVGIVLLFKLFVPTLLLRLLVIGVFSLAWFVVLQLFILPDTIYRAQWNRLADRFNKEE
jgi:O-antigen/teichoic acid export membrane protein